jgi:tRNA 2-selenouridine synthase
MGRVRVVEDAEPATLAAFDAIIDTRTPREFALDHVPGALNLPVLSNEERAEVGTIYVQESRFKARRIGGAYVAKNVAHHLQTAMADWPATFQPLVYCWRGGMRSNAMAVILGQVGWRTGVLKGGYRTYRRRVSAQLYETERALRVILLEGPTGVGKTEVLNRLAARGVQTLDLEALAQHRGSLFGALPGQAQPSQKMFESRLLAAIEQLDPARPVVVEAESSKVGQLMLPPVLWQAMTAAPRIVLSAPAPARAAYLAATYGQTIQDATTLADLLRRLPERPGRGRIEAWLALAAQGDHEVLAQALIETHYDPAYRRAARGDERPLLGAITLETLEAQEFDRAAEAVERRLGDAV